MKPSFILFIYCILYMYIYLIDLGFFYYFIILSNW